MRKMMLAVLAAAGMMATGCLGLSQDAPDITRHYVKLSGAEAATPVQRGAALLEVRPFTAAPGFGGKSFVILREGGVTEEDFYNQFYAAPAEMLQTAASEFFAASPAVSAVLPPRSQARPTHLLEGHILELLADFRDAPTARLAVRFAVLDAQASPPAILLTRTVRVQEPMASKNPGAFAQATERAFERALQDLENRFPTE